MQKAHNVIVAIGTNFRRHDNMAMAIRMIGERFGGAVFTSAISTEPVGISSAPFLNALASAYTHKNISETVNALKGIEAECGNSSELRKDNKVAMDIDLLLYDDTRMHIDDWQRPYIKFLFEELENKKRHQPSEIKL